MGEKDCDTCSSRLRKKKKLNSSNFYLRSKNFINPKNIFFLAISPGFHNSINQRDIVFNFPLQANFKSLIGK